MNLSLGDSLDGAKHLALSFQTSGALRTATTRYPTTAYSKAEAHSNPWYIRYLKYNSNDMGNHLGLLQIDLAEQAVAVPSLL